jgi:hypothetical protein
LALARAAYIVQRAPGREDLSERAASENPDAANLMTIFDVADRAGMRYRDVPEILRKEGVPRADATGWRAWLPVDPTKVTYRRETIEAWLRTRAS